MPIAIDPGETWDYVLKEERTIDGPDGKPIKNPDATVFELGHLDASEAAEIEDSAGAVDMASKTGTVASGTAKLKVLRFGLRGVRNFFERNAMGDLVPVQFEAEPDNKRNPKRFLATMRFISRLSMAHRLELASAIEEGNTITPDEKKA